MELVCWNVLKFDWHGFSRIKQIIKYDRIQITYLNGLGTILFDIMILTVIYNWDKFVDSLLKLPRHKALCFKSLWVNKHCHLFEIMTFNAEHISKVRILYETVMRHFILILVCKWKLMLISTHSNKSFFWTTSFV